MLCGYRTMRRTYHFDSVVSRGPGCIGGTAGFGVEVDGYSWSIGFVLLCIVALRTFRGSVLFYYILFFHVFTRDPYSPSRTLYMSNIDAGLV